MIMLAVMLFVAARFAVLRSVVKVQKKQFRQTVLLQQMHELKQITVSAEDLYKDTKDVEWKENNKEVVINGKYHEVVSIKEKDGIYIINIIEDSKENELFRNFFGQTDGKGQLANCIALVIGMNFVTSHAIEIKTPQVNLVKHQTHFTLKSGIEIYARTEKPPRL